MDHLRLPLLPIDAMMQMFDDIVKKEWVRFEERSDYFTNKCFEADVFFVIHVSERWNDFLGKTFARSMWVPMTSHAICYEGEGEIEVSFKNPRVSAVLALDAVSFNTSPVNGECVIRWGDLDLPESRSFESWRVFWRDYLSDCNDRIRYWNTRCTSNNPVVIGDLPVVDLAKAVGFAFWEAAKEDIVESFAPADLSLEDEEEYFRVWVAEDGVIDEQFIWYRIYRSVSIRFGDDALWEVYLDVFSPSSFVQVEVAVVHPLCPVRFLVWGDFFHAENYRGGIHITEWDAPQEIAESVDLALRQWNFWVDGSAFTVVADSYLQGSGGNLGCDAFLGPPRLPGDVIALLPEEVQREKGVSGALAAPSECDDDAPVRR